jgi:hypothetical protein
MKLYHVTSGRAYCAPPGLPLENYRNAVRTAYGSLRGVRFVRAESRGEALALASLPRGFRELNPIK